MIRGQKTILHLIFFIILPLRAFSQEEGNEPEDIRFLNNFLTIGAGILQPVLTKENALSIDSLTEGLNSVSKVITITYHRRIPGNILAGGRTSVFSVPQQGETPGNIALLHGSLIKNQPLNDVISIPFCLEAGLLLNNIENMEAFASAALRTGINMTYNEQWGYLFELEWISAFNGESQTHLLSLSASVLYRY